MRLDRAVLMLLKVVLLLGEGGLFSSPETETIASREVDPGGTVAGLGHGARPGAGTIIEAAPVSDGILAQLSQAKGFDKLKVAYDFMTDPKNKMIVSALEAARLPYCNI